MLFSHITNAKPEVTDRMIKYFKSKHSKKGKFEILIVRHDFYNNRRQYDHKHCYTVYGKLKPRNSKMRLFRQNSSL